jgi:hypothetical protein
VKGQHDGKDANQESAGQDGNMFAPGRFFRLICHKDAFRKYLVAVTLGQCLAGPGGVKVRRQPASSADERRMPV